MLCLTGQINSAWWIHMICLPLFSRVSSLTLWWDCPSFTERIVCIILGRGCYCVLLLLLSVVVVVVGGGGGEGGALTWNDYHPCTVHAFYHSNNRRTYIYSFVSHITNLRFLLWIIHCRVVMSSPTLTVTISLSFRDSSRMWNTSWGTHADQIPIILEATVWIRNIQEPKTRWAYHFRFEPCAICFW